MLQNYLKIALRNLLRHKGTAFINIFGLAVGMAACLLLLLTVKDEFTFDMFHANKERIYRLYHENQTSKGEEKISAMPIPLASALRAEMSDIQHVVQFSDEGKFTAKSDGKIFKVSPSFTDSECFQAFTFNFLQGNAETALKEKSSVVLTDETARKFFGTSAEALGKNVLLEFGNEWRTFIVSAVVAKLPENSSLDGEMFLRFEQMPRFNERKDVWDSWSHTVFVMLKPGISAQAVEQALKPFVNTHYAGDINDKKNNGIKPNAAGEYLTLHLQPLSDVHFNTILESKSALYSAYSLIAIGAVALLIACINFVNLSVARSLTRAKEVGVRKVMGAARSQITMQFLGESLVVVALAVVVGIALAELLLPVFNSAIGKKLVLFQWGNTPFLLAALLLLTVVALAAASYPALYISRFQATEALKSQVQGGKSVAPSRLRSALLVVQFTFAVALICSTIVISQQVQYLLNKPLGFNRENVVCIPTGNGIAGKRLFVQYRTALAGQPSIANMTTCFNNIGRGEDGSNYNSNIGFGYNGVEVHTSILAMETDAVETMGLTLMAGRGFSRQFPSDTLGLVINEQMARQLLPIAKVKDVAALVGVKIPVADSIGRTIIGVVKDFHYQSLRNALKPLTIVFADEGSYNFIFVRISAANTPATMNLLKTTWERIAPDVPFQGSFADENIARMYRRQTRQAAMVLTVAVVAIVLSCMGLFALAAMMITARTKEIGIRKVLGASVASIVGLLSKDFLRLVVAAIIVGTPLAWWAMNAWLQDFAYRVELSAWFFVLGGALALLIALATVSVQAVRAAMANPVDALRSE